MKLELAQTIRHYNKKNLPGDILAGLIIMAVSIPISMGYAQIAGLPAVYGLYGSVFPILFFALFFHFPAVYLRGGCGTSGTRWFRPDQSACGEWVE